MPFARARAALDDATLGLLLLCLGAGSIVAMPLAGALAARIGCRAVIIAPALPLCLTLPLLASLSGPASLAVALLGFGAGLGAIDVTMNIQAVIVERASGRPMMSGFHGLYSVGGIAGAACMTALLGMGAQPWVATLCIVACLIVALIAAGPRLLPFGGRDDGPMFALPRGIVLFIGVLCFISFLAEGAVLDWSAVFLNSVGGMATAYAGLGFASFSLAMTICRLLGDAVTRRFGGTNVLIFGGFCAAAGFACLALVPFWPAALAGFALIGVGCSNIVPVLFTAAGRQSAVPEHMAISAISTLGYAGALAGPAAIGFVAHASSLRVAFVALAIMQLALAASGRLLKV